MIQIKIIYCCMDCGDKIALTTALYRQGRCNHCAKLGKLSPKWIEIKFCIDCNKPLIKDGRPLKKRCKSCYLKTLKGSLHPSFKGGKPKCIDCGRECSTYGIIRCINCLGKFNIGKNNPNYKHGNGYGDYTKEFNQKLRNKIRKRDNFTCQCCDINEKTHIKQNKRNLAIHHIDYNKENCDESNLITVCQKCNNIANGNRDYWFAFYTYKIQNWILING